MASERPLTRKFGPRPSFILCRRCGTERPVQVSGVIPRFCSKKCEWATSNAGRYAADPEPYKARAKARAEAMPDAIKAYQAARYAANPEPYKARAKARRLADPARAQAESRAFYQANKDAYIRRARARERKLSELPSDGYRRADIFERDGWACGLCGGIVDPDPQWPHPESASIDHIIPLSLGGDDMSANVQLAHLRCNMVKGARTGGQ